ncbi:MAG TPA: hypothetical protein PLT07_02620 [Trueperaceae bacterium]|nr:hypothetical protein [Trueperaceae bacterium]
MDLGQVWVPEAVDVLPDLLEVVVPHALLAQLALETAERAAYVTDVRLGEAQRVHEVRLAAHLLAAHEVGEAHDARNVAGAVEDEAVSQVEAAA